MTQLTPTAMDPPMISVTFADRVHELSIPQAQALWVNRTIDRVRMDGEDYFMASDVALVLANQGLIHEDAFVARAGVAKGGGQCGRGWVGVKGSCKRLAKGEDRAVAQKASLKEFAQGQRVKKFGEFGTSGLQTSKQKAREAAGKGLTEPKVKARKIGEKKNTTDKTYGKIVDKAVGVEFKPNASATSKRVANNVLKSASGRVESPLTKEIDTRKGRKAVSRSIDRNAGKVMKKSMREAFREEF